MATVEGTKYTGPSIVDMSDVKDDLYDLAPGARTGMRAEQEGMPGVVEELSHVTAEQRKAANIPEHVYQEFVDHTAKVEKLRKHEATLEKALEVCTETRAIKENDREDCVSTMAKAAREAASRKKTPAIAAPFEKLIKYHSQIADKAVQTRKKNAEAKAAAEQAPARPGEPAPPA
jgi:hypothetical protein